MNEQNKETLKQELKEELSAELRRQVEQEVEEEVEEEIAQHPRYQQAMNKFKVNLIAVAATIMALGQFSEAVTLIEDGVDSLRSRLTNTVEYNLIADIHVNNTEGYILSLLGEPQVSKQISPGVVANYFHHDKFLATIFIEDQRVVAYTIIPLVDGFTPPVIEQPEFSWTFMENSYVQHPANPSMYAIDHSKITSFYLESLDSGRAGLFVNEYLGNVAIGATEADFTNLLVELYQYEVTGSDEEINQAQTRFRENAIPNLVGQGKLDLTDIQKSILTGAEFTSYFGR